MNCAFCDRTDTQDIFVPQTLADNVPGIDPRSQTKQTGVMLTLCPFHQNFIYKALMGVVTTRPCPNCKGKGLIPYEEGKHFIMSRVCGVCHGTRIDSKP